jgi:YVTN family beta-propeller protein
VTRRLLLTTLLFFACCSICVRAQGTLPLERVEDVPLPGTASRFDYQSLDSEGGRLYITHLGDGMMTVFDTNKGAIVGGVKDLSRVHGVLAAPELHRVLASATGANELAVIDDQTLQVGARVPAGDYPDGVAYAGNAKKIYVSDLHGGTDTVIDAATNQRVGTVELGGGAGNTQYDSGSGHVFVMVHRLNQLAEIDPQTDTVVAHYELPGCSGSHGLLIDVAHRLAFVACEENAKLVVFDLNSKKVTAVQSVGADPDVLAFDEGLGRLYVSAESGVVTVFDERGRNLEKVWGGFFAKNAHSVAVDQRTHRVYFPLQDVDGKPVLRIVVPSDVKRAELRFSFPSRVSARSRFPRSNVLSCRSWPHSQTYLRANVRQANHPSASHSRRVRGGAPGILTECRQRKHPRSLGRSRSHRTRPGARRHAERCELDGRRNGCRLPPT